jgi:hypothetical protein
MPGVPETVLDPSWHIKADVSAVQTITAIDAPLPGTSENALG